MGSDDFYKSFNQSYKVISTVGDAFFGNKIKQIEEDRQDERQDTRYKQRREDDYDYYMKKQQSIMDLKDKQEDADIEKQNKLVEEAVSANPGSIMEYEYKNGKAVKTFVPESKVKERKVDAIKQEMELKKAQLQTNIMDDVLNKNKSGEDSNYEIDPLTGKVKDNTEKNYKADVKLGESINKGFKSDNVREVYGQIPEWVKENDPQAVQMKLNAYVRSNVLKMDDAKKIKAEYESQAKQAQEIKFNSLKSSIKQEAVSGGWDSDDLTKNLKAKVARGEIDEEEAYDLWEELNGALNFTS